MTDQAPSIIVENLTRAFGDLIAVNDLNFTVGKGELFGLLGPDGAGKTTTLRMLSGVMKPSSGNASIHGISVVRDPEKVKHHIAYMSQRFGLYHDLTVIENINFYADLYLVPESTRSSRLERLFEFSSLGPFQNRLAGALSGGMKQKLGLCCALVHKPDVLLLDEPTFGVDPVSRRDLWLIVHEMVGEGTTVVVSTSYMDEAERFDRVALLYQGTLQKVDTPDSLQKNIGHEILAVHTDALQEARRIVESMSGVTGVVVFGESLHISTGSAGGLAPRIEARLKEAGLEVGEIRQLPPGMEDVFISCMNVAEKGSDE